MPCTCDYSDGGDYGPPELGEVCQSCQIQQFLDEGWEQHKAYMNATYPNGWPEPVLFMEPALEATG